MTRSISLNAISKTYPKQPIPAVSDITLDVAPGEFLVLFGPSGCGKSTLLRMIAGLEKSPPVNCCWTVNTQMTLGRQHATWP